MNKVHEAIKEEMKVMAREIRELKLKRKDLNRNDLRTYSTDHQVKVMKYDFRCKHIARGLLKGLKYEQIEQPRKGNEPSFKRIETEKQKFIERYLANQIDKVLETNTVTEQNTTGLTQCIACM